MLISWGSAWSDPESRKRNMKHSDLTGKIIECAYKVHNTLGFGFLEAVYQNALLIELLNSGLKAIKEKPIKVCYEDQIVGDYIADIVVEEKVILELKAIKELHPAHACPVEYTQCGA